MAIDRFALPDIGLPNTVSFPPIARTTLSNGLRVWTISHTALPTVVGSLVIDAGSAIDPANRPGLAALTADLVDEGAAGRDAIAIADAWARLGSDLDTETGTDSTAFSFATLARFLSPAIALLAETVTQPHLHSRDLDRVREQRVNRLRQLRQSVASSAERVFLRAVFEDHGYGHMALGTTTSLTRATSEDVAAVHARWYRPDRALLIVSGDVTHDVVVTAATAAFGGWAPAAGSDVPSPIDVPTADTPARVWLVDRPGAPQSELRVGHLGVERRVPGYHAIVTLNSLLGGQFSSRVNQRLRQEKGYTYGARTSFDVRRFSGTFACETSVQRDATVAAILDIIDDCRAVGRERPAAEDELERTKASLTRGYVRQFETPGQLVRAAAQLAAFGLPDDTFDRFVPSVMAVSAEAVTAAARDRVRPDALHVVIVGDAETLRPQLEILQRPVSEVVPAF